MKSQTAPAPVIKPPNTSAAAIIGSVGGMRLGGLCSGEHFSTFHASLINLSTMQDRAHSCRPTLDEQIAVIGLLLEGLRHSFTRIAPYVILILALLTEITVAKDVSFDGGSATFTVPDVFTELSKDEIQAYFPGGDPPERGFGTAGRTTIIAYHLTKFVIEENNLPDVQESFTGTLNKQIRAIEWKQNDFVQLANQKWLSLEVTSAAGGHDVHNIMLFTAHKGRMLVFYFDSTKADFPKMEKALRDSIKSISLRR